MGKILVLGGTRYFGKRLVNLLLQEGVHDVTVATRGLTEVHFDGPVHRVVLDRTSEEDLRKVDAEGPWDIIYDNICYSPNEALAAIRAFDGSVKRYVLTSTMSVYEIGIGDGPSKESDVDPYNYPLQTGDRSDFDYGEGKRLAEAAFFQKANFPVCAMRIPIVLGPDDYTRRLHFHVEHVQGGTPIGIPNMEAKISFISSEGAANFLKWLGTAEATGPINASSDGEVAIAQVMDWIEKFTGKTAIIERETNPDNMSPFGIPSSWLLDTTRAKAEGYHFDSVQDWMPELIRHIATEN